MEKVILISGKARSGKDMTANFINQELKKYKKRVLIIHYADALKQFCKDNFGWDGNKLTIRGREFLQIVGTNIARANYEDVWVDVVIALLRGFESEYDYVIIPDTRFKNEITKPQEYFDCVTIRVNNVSDNYGDLTTNQKNHLSEIDLDNYNFDYVLENHYDETIKTEISKIIDEIIR